MATRILIVAARNTTPEAFQAAFPHLGDEPPRESNGWAWGCYSLWCVDPDALDPKGIEGPVVTITTCDDEVWYLRIHGREEDHFGIANHHFLLDPEELEDEDDETFGEFLLELYEMVARDCWPSVAVRELKDLTKSAAVPKFHALQAKSTAEALTRFGISFDQDQLTKCITGEAMTEQERHSPVGNLPAFLSCIGLDAITEMLSGDDEPEDADESHKASAHVDDEYDDAVDDGHALDIVAEVVKRTTKAAPVALDEPVAHQLAKLDELWLLSWFCNSDADVALTIDLPEGTEEPQWPDRPVPCEREVDELCDDDEDDFDDEPHELTSSRQGQQVRIGLGWSSVWRRGRWLQAIGKSLAELPSGTQVELLSAEIEAEEGAHGSIESPGTQVFRGTVSGDQLHVTHTHPGVSAAKLRDALALAAETETEAAITARSEDELKALFATAEASGLLFPLPELDGLDVIHEDKHSLAAVFFRERFSDAWPVTSENELGDLLGLGEALGNAIASSLPGQPKAGEIDVVFDGEFSRYRKAEDEEVERPNFDTFSESLDREFEKVRSMFRTEILGEDIEEPEEPQPDDEGLDMGSPEEISTAMCEIGFSHLGDLVCEKFSDVTLRGFAPDEGDAYACHMRSLMSSGVVEFVTSFTDGTTYTTSTNPSLQNLPHKGIYGSSYPEDTPEQLLARHREHIHKFATEGRQPMAIDPTLEGLARTLDAFLAKQMA